MATFRLFIIANIKYQKSLKCLMLPRVEQLFCTCVYVANDDTELN